MAEETILWNALQMHPHKPGNVRSNRTPTMDELALGEPAMRILVDAFPQAKLVAIGRKAEHLLLGMGIRPVGISAILPMEEPKHLKKVTFACGLKKMAGSNYLTAHAFTRVQMGARGQR